MRPERVRELCLRLPGTWEDFPFGPETSVFKVRAGGGVARMFALTTLAATPLSISLKCEPALAVALRAAHPEITGAWHLNKTHWNGVALDGELEEAMVADLIEDSWDLVVAGLPRRDRELLAWRERAADSE
ncbi:MmcQ/YjbR family DNA-binding protein [Tersicoccus sp. Bi-70]|uniref:MmcQ/YjbR family DNA-binding protein n=1 Tax=Tersicoccus sp. Bi-70 TaxID=1897634 RepID=UPI0009774AAC|nr:MmcQ/YjbR family DNA-binding protein [Tersicoccus sp. Bi-70]OMH32470.1 MmcQ-like protein [Tersicoccus sp. Bi-70]